MKDGLSLLPNQAKFQAQRNRLKKQIRGWLALMVTLWLVVVVVLWGSEVVLRLATRNEQVKLRRKQSEYDSLSENVVLSQQLKYRAKLIGKVLSHRFEYSRAFKLVKDLLPGDWLVSKLELKGQKLFSLTVKVARAQDVDFLEEKVALVNWGEVEGLESMKLGSLSWNPDGWQFNLEVSLK